ncbi:hypothetical protein CCMA1212_002574 [Trichoderma ghanense]|uniref:SSCRP protein n=1 Tax=Trichoderma ghanense TaxID=65468 RepID=A0ABY2HAS6_9HYPO
MLVCIAACGLAPEVALQTRLTHQAPCGRCRLKQRRREIRHQQHDTESSQRGSSFPMISVLLDFADPSSPDKTLRPLAATASARSARFRFAFLGTKYGVRSNEFHGASPCLAAPRPPNGMASARHSWYCGIRYQHTDSPYLQQNLDAEPEHRSPHGQSVTNEAGLANLVRVEQPDPCCSTP